MNAEVAGVLTTFFRVTLCLGLALLALDGYWLLSYRRGHAELSRYQGGFVANRCPTCGGAIRLEESTSTHLSIPMVQRRVTCDRCGSALEGLAPTCWRYRVDAAVNPEVAWLYGDETVSDDEFRLIASGGQTPRAQAKIEAREEQRRREARANALAEITAGNLVLLAQLESRLVEAPTGVEVRCGDGLLPTGFPLQRGERALLVMRPVSLGEQRTRDGAPYVRAADRGEFVITDRRYGFAGTVKSVRQKLDVVEWVRADGDTLTVARSNKKSPDYFIGLDSALAEAAITGATLRRSA